SKTSRPSRAAASSRSGGSSRGGSSGAKPPIAKPVRPRQQQILEIRRYPKPANPPAAAHSDESEQPKQPASPAAGKPAPKSPSLSGPPTRPGKPNPKANGAAIKPPTLATPSREVAKPAAPPPERIVTTSGATRPDQLKPKLVSPPSRPSAKAPAPGRSDEGSQGRVARPVLKRDRTAPRPSSNDNRPGRSTQEGSAAPPAPKKPVIELRRPVSRKAAVENTEPEEIDNEDDDQSFVDPALELRRPSPPRPPKRRDRTAVEEDDEQEIKPKKVAKTKRQRIIVDDDDDFEDLESFSSDVTPEQITLSLMRPPKPKGQRQAKPAPTTKKTKQRSPSRRERRERRQEAEPEKPEMIVLTGGISVHDLAEQLAVPQTEIIKLLFFKGIATNVNQTLDMPTAEMVATEFGVEPVTAEEAPEARKVTEMIDEEDLGSLTSRPPVVTIMGHVDHGKTSLLDYIRQAKVTEGEAGGITQHIGAYHVDLQSNPNSDRKSGQIVFLDTPGHEAFTAMRARGTRVTDIAILVVAADDGVRPQTIEAISHAKAAGVPIVVAINKIDKEAANPDRVKQELMEHNLVPEEYGGDTIMVPVSAITGENVDTILEMLLLVAEVEDLQANPERLARGTVIEAHLDKARGPVATLLVQNGTLKVGDAFAAGPVFGRVKAMVDDRGHRSSEVKPSFAVEVLGLNDVPPAGEEFEVYAEEKEARTAADEKAIEQRQSRLAQTMASRRVTLNSLSEQAKEGELKELNLVLKADVQGSLEAILGSLQQLPQNEV
ncbi:MAG: translation initiation factor IF-2, partial [Cyanobacteria bacterium J06607_13]